MRVLFLLVCMACACMGQVLNGYINPMWVTDRRGRGRSLSGRYSDSIYREPRVISDLVYMDENGRYHPVYRQERMFRSPEAQTMAQPYYRDNEYTPLSSERIIEATNM